MGDTLLSLLEDVHPQLVVTAPDGQQLYIDVTPSADGSQSASLWPQGFKVSLATGAAPTSSTVTTSPTSFFVDQAPTLLTAPGIGGISWGAWLFLISMISLLPLVGIVLWKRK